MENQWAMTEAETSTAFDSHQIEELLDLQLALVGGGCVEYCPY